MLFGGVPVWRREYDERKRWIGLLSAIVPEATKLLPLERNERLLAAFGGCCVI